MNHRLNGDQIFMLGQVAMPAMSEPTSAQPAIVDLNLNLSNLASNIIGIIPGPVIVPCQQLYNYNSLHVPLTMIGILHNQRRHLTHFPTSGQYQCIMSELRKKG